VKIVILIDSLHSIAAGSERQIYKLAEGLVGSGHTVTLVLLRSTPFSKTLAEFPCPVECLEINSISSVDAARKMWGFRKKIILAKTEIVHAYFPDACLLAPLWLKRKGTKVITSRRDMGLIYQGKPSWIYKFLQPRTDYIISNSSAVAKHTSAQEKIPPGKSVVIYNGLENFNPTQNPAPEIFKRMDSIKFILVANIKPVKRIMDAVIAIKVLRAQGENVELALVGEHQDKNYCQSLQEYITQYQLSDCIYLTGSMKEPRTLLPQADVGLLVSESEGLSNTIMEYMQLGLPVIATAVGGNPELVTNGNTGYLVPKADPIQLTQAMQKLIQSKNLRQNLGTQGKAIIQQQFSIDAMITKHEKLYQAIS
jgi:L-malate glycosyltransferase